MSDKVSKSSNYYIKVGNSYHSVSKYLNEVTQYLDSTIKTEIDLIILDKEIEKIRVVLNQLANSKKNLYKYDLIVRTSKLLDKLLVIYYYNKYE